MTYAFDYADRPYSVSGTYGGTGRTYVSATTYAPFGPRLATSFGNGTTQTFTYDQRYLPTENKLTAGGSTTLSDLTYTTNAVGYITQITDALNAAYNIAYVYGGNATNMMTDANTGSGLWGKAHYADAYAQNLTQALVTGSSARVFKLSQRTGQIQSVFIPSTGASVAVSYDAAGNEVSGVGTYTYSSRNLLASGDNITYTYDGSRQRVSATTTISGSSKTETSLYGPGRHLEMQSALTSGSVAYDYIWLGDLPVAEEDIAGSHTYWTAVDHRGAPIILTNASAAVAWQMDSRPFGNVYQVRTGSSIHEPLRFPGQEAELFDGSAGVNGFSGRLYNGMRWYRPQFARYMQVDPFEYAGSPYNLYAYAENNPINFADPSGLDVYVGFHWIPNVPDTGHAYIILTPTPGSSVTQTTTISGEPSGSALYGSTLVSYPDKDLNEPRVYGMQPVQPPPGMTMAEFQDALENSDKIYGAETPSIPYDFTGDVYGYNSNGYFSGILNANGINGEQILGKDFPTVAFPGAADPISPAYFNGPCGGW